MRADLALDASDVQWAVNAYLVVSAACIVLGGDASDRFGARRVAVAGLVLFAAASASIALSTSAAMLLTGRASQRRSLLLGGGGRCTAEPRRRSGWRHRRHRGP
jgi:MFS transporter, DHA2 family, methylenomycin A resistance protein